MPELPEVETVRRGLSQHVIGKKFKSIDVLHPRATSLKSIAPIQSLRGAKVKNIARRGKFLWFELDRPEVLVAHLGMSGQFLIQPKAKTDEKHLRVRLGLGSDELRFIDQRTFGWLSVDQLIDGVPSCARHIALDPFDPKFVMKNAVVKFRSKKTQVKKALLDQEVISGVGNIYADESLWLAQINPQTIASALSPKKVERLLSLATQVMASALAVGGTSFDERYVNVNGESGYFERSLNVYGREGQPCPRCSGPISRIAFANRSTHYCFSCQK